MQVTKDYVTFYSPGTFVCESTTKEIDGWDVEKAKEMARNILERHNATPFGFRFSTRGRYEMDLDSKEIKKSPMYYLGGVVETYEEIVARNDPNDSILLSNMRNFNAKKVITNTNSWKYTGMVADDDVILEWEK